MLIKTVYVIKKIGIANGSHFIHNRNGRNELQSQKSETKIMQLTHRYYNKLQNTFLKVRSLEEALTGSTILLWPAHKNHSDQLNLANFAHEIEIPEQIRTKNVR